MVSTTVFTCFKLVSCKFPRLEDLKLETSFVAGNIYIYTHTHYGFFEHLGFVP